MNDKRILRLISEARETFKLDLSKLTVFTEAASGWFSLTPLIAELAGARAVIAVGRDSPYGAFSEVKAYISDLARRWGCRKKIKIVSKKITSNIARSDIITNLGFVRPINSKFISAMRPTAAIALMWEPWEFRSEDLDLEECKAHGIPVLGTNEQISDLRMFDYLGMLALKLLLEVQIEVLMSRVVVLGSGLFGRATVRLLKAVGAVVGWINPSMDIEGGCTFSIPVWKNFNHPKVLSLLSVADALVVVEHRLRDQMLGSAGMLDFHELKKINRDIIIIHICGEVDKKNLFSSGLQYHPKSIQSGGTMSVTTAYLGPKPLIDLHTAGLRVGECLARARLTGATVEEAKAFALEFAPARDFV